MTAKLSVILLATMACSLPAAGKDYDTQPAGNAAAERADSILVEEADSKALIPAELKISELTRDNETLRNALQDAIPFVEASLETGREIINSDLDKAYTTALEEYTERLLRLSSYSEAIDAEAKTLRQFAEIAAEYAVCNEFDRKAYSREMVEDTERRLLDIYDAGAGILNAAQRTQIDSLYVKADNYRGAVEAFDALIKAIDAETEQFRDNQNADKIAGQEVERVIGNSAECINTIKQYRHTAQLLEQYIKELKETPRSSTPEIREAIGNMLNQAPGEEQTNNKQ